MRDFCVTIPDRIGLIVMSAKETVDSVIVRLIDQYLSRRGEMRTSSWDDYEPIGFDDIPVLFNGEILPQHLVDKDGFLIGQFDADLLPEGSYETFYNPDLRSYYVQPLPYKEQDVI